jgi:NAD(P)-dependent dehydrogenase (short-subunit alcohol dehydrogenase family)
MRLRSRTAKAAAGGETPPWERLGELEEYRELCRMRLKHAVPVRESLVLVSQIQRSGGTLLSQLFDGHPECHAHPYELKIGYPRKFNWPPLDLDRPEAWFETLFEKRSVLHFLGSYHKSAKKRNAYDVFPFLFLPRLQGAIFEACVAEWRPGSEREVLDCYFTSYFNAWLDNQNLYSGPKRAVTGFVPRLAMELANVERFFAAYPQGTLVSIVRDPRAWYVSASGYQPDRYADVEVALPLWRRSVEAAVEARGRFGERVVVVTYERLVLETEAVMGALAERVGIAMSPVLLSPSFNGRPIRANSSEAVAGYGVLAERVDAYRDSLPAETVERSGVLAGDLYERAAAAAVAGT